MLQILHLEDNLLDAELIEATLLDGGFDFAIRRVDNRADFTRCVTEHEFDVILADYSLPSFDGLSALRIALECCPATPFIIISGALGEELAVQTLKSGATDFILKHRLEMIAPAVNRALREAEERAARQAAEQNLEVMLEREQEARVKAEEANRLKDEFLATVSHELRTPLNAIYGWITLLRRGELSEADGVTALEVIERNSKVQIQLVEDLLDVSRMITGKLRLDIAPVEPHEIINSAIEAARPAAEAKCLRLETEIDPAAQIVFADASRLQQIVWNLLSNAVKFTGSGGRVKVSLKPVNGNVEICVRDTGEGIPPDFLPYVFDRFRQAEQGTTRPHGGLGLGLAIVKNLVEMHGGEITATSEGAGRGATFTVTLPQNTVGDNGVTQNATPIDAPDIEGYSEPATDAPLKNLRILAIEDDADSRELLLILLGQHGAIVQTAASAAQALEKLQDNSFDALISDVGMPLIDGYEMITKIRALPLAAAAQIPAVALTGFARAEDERRALAAGFDAHVAKPIEPAKLVAAVTSILKNK